MDIHKAEAADYQTVRAFYHTLIDAAGNVTDSVGWKKDIYPAPDFLEDSIRNGELFIGVEQGEIIAAMVLNHKGNDGYREFTWPTEAADSEVTVIHALGVHPAHTGKGHAKRMVRFAFEYARKHRQRVIRLDVLKGNAAAKGLYMAMGFACLHTLPMFYEDTGWTDFELYELSVQ